MNIQHLPTATTRRLERRQIAQKQLQAPAWPLDAEMGFARIKPGHIRPHIHSHFDSRIAAADMGSS